MRSASRKRPVIGQPIPPEEQAPWLANPRGFVAWLRERTLALDPKRAG